MCFVLFAFVLLGLFVVVFVFLGLFIEYRQRSFQAFVIDCCKASFHAARGHLVVPHEERLVLLFSFLANNLRLRPIMNTVFALHLSFHPLKLSLRTLEEGSPLKHHCERTT